MPDHAHYTPPARSFSLYLLYHTQPTGRRCISISLQRSVFLDSTRDWCVALLLQRGRFVWQSSSNPPRHRWWSSSSSSTLSLLFLTFTRRDNYYEKVQQTVRCVCVVEKRNCLEKKRSNFILSLTCEIRNTLYWSCVLIWIIKKRLSHNANALFIGYIWLLMCFVINFKLKKIITQAALSRKHTILRR